MSESSEYFQRVTLTEPSKHSDSFGGYISYKVNLLANNPLFSAREIVVERRYRDFCWLQDQLCVMFPGAIVPPLPEKQGVGRFLQESPVFLEIRRMGLELFVNRILQRNDFLKTEQLKLFLEADEKDFIKAKDLSKKDTSITKNVMTIFANKLSSLSAPNSKGVELEKTEADIKVEEIINYTTQLETQLTNIQKHMALMVKRHQERMDIFFELSQSTTALSQLQMDSLTDTLTNMSSTTEKLSNQGSIFCDKLQLQVEVPLHDLLRYIGAVKLAFQKRQAVRSAYWSIMSTLEAQQTALQRAITNPNVNDDMKAVRQEVVNKSTVEVAAAGEELAAASERFERDFVGFKAWILAELKVILASFVRIQVEMSAHTEKVWMDISVPPSLLGKQTSAMTGFSSGSVEEILPSPTYDLYSYLAMTGSDASSNQITAGTTTSRISSLLSSVTFSRFAHSNMSTTRHEAPEEAKEMGEESHGYKKEGRLENDVATV